MKTPEQIQSKINYLRDNKIGSQSYIEALEWVLNGIDAKGQFDKKPQRTFYFGVKDTMNKLGIWDKRFDREIGHYYRSGASVLEAAKWLGIPVILENTTEPKPDVVVESPKPKVNKHKWSPTEERNIDVCSKCGCIRDQTVLRRTRYTLKGVLLRLAPPCITETADMINEHLNG